MTFQIKSINNPILYYSLIPKFKTIQESTNLLEGNGLKYIFDLTDFLLSFLLEMSTKIPLCYQLV
jgi:hypothetical protein